MPAQFKTYLPEGTTPINVQDMAFDWNTATGNLNYRKDNLKLFNGNAVIKTFTCDNLNRFQQTKPPTGGVVCLTSAQVTGQAAITMTYEPNGNIAAKNDLGNYVYSATPPNAVEKIWCGTVPYAPHQDITYTPFNKTATVTEGVYELIYTYGPDQQRKKSELKNNGTTEKTIIYTGNYEEVTVNGNTYKVHYIAGGSGLTAIYVTPPSGGGGDLYYVYTDHLGSILKLTDASGNIVFEQNFDAWGRNRNPNDWSFDLSSYTPPTLPAGTFDPAIWLIRGYTGHEHLKEFALINMNGRVYDPVIGRVLSPDNFVQNPYGTQGYNRYSYAGNNPLRYTDPNGEFLGTIFTAIWDFAATILTKGAIDPWNTSENRKEAWREFDPTAQWSKTNKAWRIDVGAFKTDPNKSFFGRVGEFVSRYSWQLPQTVIGYGYAHTSNVFYNRVRSVKYYGGATILNVTDLPMDFDQASAVTLGNYIVGEGISADPFEHGPFYGLSWGSYLLRHEYGHYIQSQRTGIAYLPKYGIPSAFGSNSWMENDAEYWSDRYFARHYSGQNAQPTFLNISYDENYRPVNPKWWEYGLLVGATGAGFLYFPAALGVAGGYVVGGVIVGSLNLNRGR